MSVTKIFVIYDAETGQLTLDKPVVDLASGDQIQWIFPNTPSHLLPHIYFSTQEGVEKELFGPFQYLEPFSDRLIGLGNSGEPGPYPYTVLLLNENGPVATSSGIEAIINNLSGLENTSPDALVRYEAESDPHFLVEPFTLTLEWRRTAIWYIEDIPPGHFVTFRFNGFEDPMTGPFLSFSLSRGFGSSWLANGAGFLFDQDPLQLGPPISYRVTLRNSLGTVVAVKDPVIEPLGTPPISAVGLLGATGSSTPDRFASRRKRGG